MTRTHSILPALFASLLASHAAFAAAPQKPAQIHKRQSYYTMPPDPATRSKPMESSFIPPIETGHPADTPNLGLPGQGLLITPSQSLSNFVAQAHSFTAGYAGQRFLYISPVRCTTCRSAWKNLTPRISQGKMRLTIIPLGNDADTIISATNPLGQWNALLADPPDDPASPKQIPAPPPQPGRIANGNASWARSNIGNYEITKPVLGEVFVDSISLYSPDALPNL